MKKFLNNPTILGISSGIGVSLYPFRRDNILANVEPRSVFHSPGNFQWKANFGDVPLYKSLPEVKVCQQVDIMISSPDCGAGSIFRMSRAKTWGDHTKNDSLNLFFEAVERYNPKLFLFENLNNLFKSLPEEEFNEKLKGYRLIKYSLPVSAWGNSQVHRKRLVIIGIREDLPNMLEDYFKLPKESEPLTCGELYGDLNTNPPKGITGLIRESLKETITLYAGFKATNSQIRDGWLLYGKSKRWPVIGRKFSNAPGVYRNFNDSFPNTARKANRQYDQNGYMLTPRHLARIMGIPDHFIIYHSDKPNLNYWINKGRVATTKGMVYEIPLWFRKCLLKSEYLWLS